MRTSNEVPEDAFLNIFGYNVDIIGTNIGRLITKTYEYPSETFSVFVVLFI